MTEPELMCVGIVATPLQSLSELIETQFRRTLGDEVPKRHGPMRWHAFYKQRGDFYNVLRAEICIFSAASGASVYVCNLADGWVSLFRNVIKAGSLDAYFFRSTRDDTRDYKVFEMIRLLGGTEVRHVRALQDEPRWTWLSLGSPLPFELTERYARRRVRDRLSVDVIDGYSDAAGFRLGQLMSFDGPVTHYARSEPTTAA